MAGHLPRHHLNRKKGSLCKQTSTFCYPTGQAFDLDGGSAVGVAHHKCGESYVDNLVDALGHNYVQSGNVYTCSRCGDSYTGHEHSYTEATTQPTCTTAGYTVYTCSCGDSYTVEIPALGHNYVLVGQSGNVATYECSRCGHRYTAVIPVDPQPPVEYSLRSSNPVTEHHEYVYASGQLMRETITTTANGTSTTEVLDFIYGSGSTPLALVYTNGTANPVTYYFVTNMQGDVVKLVNASGATVASYAYDAWGKVLSATGSMAEVNPIRYRGYYYDAETELYYLQSRYYDPGVKRFINADGVTTTGQGFLGANMFAYCLNSPVCSADSCGMKTTKRIDDTMVEVKYSVKPGGTNAIEITVDLGGRYGDLEFVLTIEFDVFEPVTFKLFGLEFELKEDSLSVEFQNGYKLVWGYTAGEPKKTVLEKKVQSSFYDSLGIEVNFSLSDDGTIGRTHSKDFGTVTVSWGLQYAPSALKTAAGVAKGFVSNASLPEGAFGGGGFSGFSNGGGIWGGCGGVLPPWDCSIH